VIWTVPPKCADKFKIRLIMSSPKLPNVLKTTKNYSGRKEEIKPVKKKIEKAKDPLEQ
jgi:hypothetical protein